MTSIHTNASSMTAMATLRNLSALGARAQSAVSTGMRISDASHNAAYWSIATTMRSDSKAIATVGEALGLSAAKIDVAYSAMTGAIDTASEVKARLLAATVNRSDAQAIQTEIDQLVKQARTSANSAVFAGSNWLYTDVDDFWEADVDKRTVSLTSSYSRTAEGNVMLGHIDIDLRSTSLFNVGGGGIFEADPRSPKTIGGMRSVTADGAFSTSNMRAGSHAMQVFTFSGPVDLSTGAVIEFDLTVDADSPDQGLPAPLHPGTTSHVLIDRSLVESVLPASGGVISTYKEMASVLSASLSGTGAYASLVTDWQGGIIPDRYALVSSESSSLDGSAVSIDNLTFAAGGLQNFPTRFGTRGNSMTLAFSAFKVHEDVEISFQFEVNGSTQNHVITRDLVDGILGNGDGKVNSVADMHQLLDSLIGQPGLIIEDNGTNSLTIRTDSNDRFNGSKSRIGFSGINVNIEPLAAFGLQDIDVAAHYDLLPAYIDAVDTMLQKAISGAAVLGAAKSRVELQRSFTSSLLDSVERGISQLVDADMEKEITRLKALDVQMQLAVQALGIANAAPGNLIQLFSGR